MKYFLILALFFNCITTLYSTSTPLLVIVLMVKNEGHIGQQEPVIVETLRPFVKAGIDSFFVFDTGSIDKTVEIAETFFKEQNITDCYSAQEPFIDFATSRNRALELAEQQFPDACFMLMPDAEWKIHNAQTLLNFCQEHRHDLLPSYDIRLQLNNVDFYQTRLIRCSAHLRFSDAVHEALPRYSSNQKIPAEVFFEVCSSPQGTGKSRKRWLRDIDVLLQELEKEPNNPRTLFYLAQTYECLGDLEKAFHYYKTRASINGWDEENFITHYRLASIIEHLSYHNPTYSWSQALEQYLHAYALRSHRIEPLLNIAQHYWNIGQKQLCYFFAYQTVEVPYPNNDILFVENDAYEFKRYEIISKSAWYAGKYALGAWATKKALEACPELIQLHRNLALYSTKVTDEKNSNFCFNSLSTIDQCNPNSN